MDTWKGDEESQMDNDPVTTALELLVEMIDGALDALQERVLPGAALDIVNVIRYT